MLSISGIQVAFVIFRQPDAVFISARSIGKVNVQVILEPLGGGGNAATAGVQLRNVTQEEAYQRLIEAIEQYFANA